MSYPKSEIDSEAPRTLTRDGYERLGIDQITNYGKPRVNIQTSSWILEPVSVWGWGMGVFSFRFYFQT